jgi:hypothetical protein
MRNQEISNSRQIGIMAGALDEISNHNKSVKTGDLSQKDYHDFLDAQFNQSQDNLPEFSSQMLASESAAEDITNRFGRTFDKAGFALVTEDDYSITLALSNIDRAREFLSKIPDDDSYGMNRVVAAVSRTIAPVVRGLSDMVDEEDFQRDVSDLKELCDELSSRRPFGELEEAYILLDAARDGFLHEQVLVERSNILATKDSPVIFWHHQDTAAKVYESWANAISLLKELKKNPQAHELTENVATALKKGVAAFEASVKLWTDKGNLYTDEKYREYAAVARLVRGDYEQIINDF